MASIIDGDALIPTEKNLVDQTPPPFMSLKGVFLTYLFLILGVIFQGSGSIIPTNESALIIGVIIKQ